MPGKVQNPDSWFYRARINAGFPNAAALAELIGVPKVTVYQWERGSAAVRPTHRPSKEHILQLEEALKVPAAELIEKLWRERDGDPCPCGCGGKKSFEKTPPEARSLVIVIPCAECGYERVHKPWKKSRHRKLCPTCANTIDPIELVCKTCRTPKRVKPHYENARQRRIAKGLSPEEYQCSNCGSLERMNRKRDEQLRDIEAREWGGKKSAVKSRSVKARRALFRKNRHLLYGGKLRTGFTAEEQERGRRTYAENAAAGKKYPNKTRSQLVRWWNVEEKDLPASIGFGICIHCDTVLMSFVSDEPHFHKACHDQWERTEAGRRYQSKKLYGKTATLPASMGRPVTGEKLKLHWSWAIKYYFAEKSYDKIAKESGVDRSSVKEAIARLIDRLHPPSLMSKRFQPGVTLLLEASGRSIP